MTHRLASTVFDDPFTSNSTSTTSASSSLHPPSSKRPRMDVHSTHALSSSRNPKPLLSRADSTTSLPSPPPTIDVRRGSSSSSTRGPRTFVSSPVSATSMDVDVDDPAPLPAVKTKPLGIGMGMTRQLSNPFFFLGPTAAAAARSQQPSSTSSRHLFAAAALNGSPTSGAARRRAARNRGDKDRIVAGEEVVGRRLDESSDEDEEMGQEDGEEEEDDGMGRKDPGNVFLCGPGEVGKGKRLAEVEERLMGGRRPGIAMTYVFRGKRITYDSVPPELASESPFQPKFLFPTASPPPPSRSPSPTPTPRRTIHTQEMRKPPATPGEAAYVNGMPTPAKTAERRRGAKLPLGKYGMERTQICNR